MVDLLNYNIVFSFSDFSEVLTTEFREIKFFLRCKLSICTVSL